MQWTGLNELREKYLSFFESKGHLRLPSFPLVPIDDSSLLLINSGMAPMKKWFLGQAVPPKKRVTTCQKCIRTPDIERVGKTSRHGTYFEMLGNFSFGDYFKVEATAWAWEFITKVIQIPEDRIWVSTYTDDDEARDIWINKVGVRPDRIVILGKEDNFWEIGSGPCGPCSEIYYDRGEEYGCGSPDCAVGCDCDRYVEFWNLVFSQFDTDGKGTYNRLEHPNIDTGMGLERLACICQGVDNLFEVDTVQNIMKHICKIANVEYRQDEKVDVSLRVITDHIRSTTFMVADGVVPQNEGRGYVLRRLLRRAARHGRLLGIHRPFLYEVCDTVIDENATAYPELVEKRDYIKKIIKIEEERFSKTIDQGMELFNHIIDKIDSNMEKSVVSGAQAFKLYDTFGFPIDLIREIAQEKQIELDEAGFEKLMNEQRQRARNARHNTDAVAWSTETNEPITVESVFVGYTDLKCEAKVVAIIKDGEQIESAGDGDTVSIILDRTPFYAESGGQVADTGVMMAGATKMNVLDCKKAVSGQFMHICEIESGCVELGDVVEAAVNEDRRRAIMRNHTAAHLLQAALRHILGDHVHQAGQLVDDHRMRFDFTHFSAVTPEELVRVEEEINRIILEGRTVTVREMDLEEAKKEHAMALFSEKYDQIVRVVAVDGYSTELCGGTHVDNSAKLGLFKIVSESSVAAGVRRIEAATGLGVMDLLTDANNTIIHAAENLKLSNPADLVARSAAITLELKARDHQIEEMQKEIADARVGELFDSAIEIEGIKLIAAGFAGTKPDVLRVFCDRVRDKAPKAVVVLSGMYQGKGTLAVACGKDAVKMGAHAGKLVKEIAAFTGGSGGRPDSAMGGVGDPFKVDEALAKAPEIMKAMLKNKSNA